MSDLYWNEKNNHNRLRWNEAPPWFFSANVALDGDLITDDWTLCLYLQIWVRNYQILEQQPENALEAQQVKKQHGNEATTSLVEIGPRFVLDPIRIFRGSFGGQTLFQNADFVSPNEVRADEKRLMGRAYEDRKESQDMRKKRKTNLVLPEDPLADVFR